MTADNTELANPYNCSKERQVLHSVLHLIFPSLICLLISKCSPKNGRVGGLFFPLKIIPFYVVTVLYWTDVN